MTSEEFARAAKQCGSDAATRTTLHNLKERPGRLPDPAYVRRASWSPADQEFVAEVIGEAAESAVLVSWLSLTLPE
jgi:hypothetical protein